MVISSMRNMNHLQEMQRARGLSNLNVACEELSFPSDPLVLFSASEMLAA